ncbi:MAG: DUF975 family protein [Oscillospiraceae bacterium]|nr:DUF975 family protein [Oscillospiraceae bacterium]
MDWTSSELKGYARKEMKRSLGHYIGVSFVLFLTSMVIFLPFWVALDLETGGGLAIFNVILWAGIIFIDLPLSVGFAACYIRAPHGERNLGNLFIIFGSGKYWSVVLAMLRLTAVVFLWALLFIIPGIVKAYQYHMVPYILSESPGISGKEAMAISRQMTDGHKSGMLFLDIFSFLGWEILASIPLVAGFMLGIRMLSAGNTAGILLMVLAYLIFFASFVVIGIYYQATYAQLYFKMRAEYFKQPDTLPESHGGLDPRYQPPGQ